MPHSEFTFDILRGAAAAAGSPLLADLARAVSKHPEAELSIAFNHKQIASKQWLLDCLYGTLGSRFGTVHVLGGWHGVLAALLFNDARFEIGGVMSVDLDASCEPVARALNHRRGERFEARTADMLTLDYAAMADGLVVNTSCEHLPNFKEWLALVKPGTKLVLQSNDYFREPDHASCFATLAAFRDAAGLSHLAFAGERAAKNYTRFMLIGEK